MASSYPGALDALTNPTGSDSMATVSHAGQHTAANDAIEAMQAELGTNPRGASATVKARLDGLVAGPASATDNALVRFDGTGGKTTQNSGITVDDSGNVSSDLTVSKATPRITSSGASAGIRVTASSGQATVFLDRVAGQYGLFDLRTGTSSRWQYGITSGAESGSNVGSDFALYAIADNGSTTITTALAINRATGKTTLGSVGATAGLELGASGPRVMSGTGSPESVVTAPVGSTWIDTAATTGAIKWVKATGTGNTGWVVEYGNTGWRDVTASMTTPANMTIGQGLIRRVGGTVFWTGYQSNTAAIAAATIYSIPTGFQPSQVVNLQGGADSGTEQSCLLRINAATVNYRSWTTTGSNRFVSGFWPTNDAWPSSLPGSAA